MLFTFACMVWGLTGDCPYRPEFDEALSVSTALTMVKTGDPNPHWLAHPGSTLIYPLAGYYHFLNSAVFHGAMSEADFDVQKFMYENVFTLFYIPRYLNVFLFVASVPLVFAIAQEVFNKRVGLLSIWLFSISPLLVFWIQLLRSDASALFYSLIAIYACLKMYRQPSLKMQTLFGISLGLAISSRWPSLALLSVFTFVNAALIYQNKDPESRRRNCLMAVYSIALAAIVFSATSPYVFIDYPVLIKDLIEEKAAHGLGCDGLSPPQNFMWYFQKGIPEQFYPPQCILAVMGVALAFWKRQFLAITLAVYTLAILVGTSLHAFHAVKWLVPVIPMFALFAANALVHCSDFIQEKMTHLSGPKTGAFTAIAALVICMLGIENEPFMTICRSNYARSYISTDIEFYEWINKNISHGTPICFVGVWEGQHKSDYKVLDVLWDPGYFDKANGGKYQSPFDIYDMGYKYFIWTDNHCPLYLAEPDKYPRECKFFKELFDNSEIVKEITPKTLDVKNMFVIPQRGFIWRLYKFTPKVPRLP